MSGVNVKRTLQMARPGTLHSGFQRLFLAPQSSVSLRQSCGGVRTSAGLGVSAPVGARAAMQWQAQ
jgi:hypothetical protein